MKYDIFISYRRKGGSERAELLKAIFVQHGYNEADIFMDTHSLRGGDFRHRLTDAIENSNNVVVLITKGCFDEIKENDFWIFEIAKAIELKKNVIPVFFDGITSIEGEDLPQTLKDLPSQNAIGYSHEYADAFYSKLLSFIKKDPSKTQNLNPPIININIKPNKKIKKEHWIIAGLIALCLTLLLTCFVIFIFNSKGFINKQKSDVYKTENNIFDTKDKIEYKNTENYANRYGDGINKQNDSEIILSPGSSIDLGLSVEWASCNVGASSPEEPGGYFAWGEIYEKDEYNKETYAYTTKEYGYIRTKKIASNISGTKYDVANITMGDGFRIPTKQEMKELITNCSWTSSYYNGQKGFVVKGTNGNTIFIPKVGYKENLTTQPSCYYWTSSTNDHGTPYSLHLSYSGADLINHASVELGLPIRPVKSKNN